MVRLFCAAHALGSCYRRARVKAGARSPQPTSSALGWTGAARPLDRCAGRNVPTHLHPEQDRRGHPGAHLPGTFMVKVVVVVCVWEGLNHLSDLERSNLSFKNGVCK